MAPAPHGSLPDAAGAKSSDTKRSTVVRDRRRARGLTQQQLADLADMHRNSIRNIESGRTREISSEHASALSAALRIEIEELGLFVRSPQTGRASIRLRQLTPDQRQVLHELLTLPPDELAIIRAAMARLRQK